jgi:excinuclease UvrABC nuclease subunit
MNKEIMKMDVDEFRKWFCPSVYLLTNNDQVVYVGQSIRGLGRIGEHLRDKEFNGITIIPTMESELSVKEAEYIIRYEPYYNRSLPRNDRYMSRKMICRELGISMWDFRRLKPTTLFMEYYDIEQVVSLLSNESGKP